MKISRMTIWICLISAISILGYLFFSSPQIKIIVSPNNEGNHTFLVRSYLDSEETIPLAYDSVKAEKAYYLDIPLDSIFSVEELVVLIGHPLYGMEQVKGLKNPFLFRWQEIKVTPKFLNVREAYRNGGLPLIDIANHINYILDSHLPEIGLETVAEDTFLFQRELIMLPASARWKMGETLGWSKREVEDLRKEMYRKHQKIMSQLSDSYGQVNFPT